MCVHTVPDVAAVVKLGSVVPLRAPPDGAAGRSFPCQPHHRAPPQSSISSSGRQF